MIMCRRATELMSQRLDRQLIWKERISLRLHLAMCGACTQCNRQFDVLHEAGKRFEPAAQEQERE